MDEQTIRQIIREELTKQPPIQRATCGVKEAAEYLGVCEDTVLTLVREKKIAHTRARSRILFRISGLDEWMSEQERINSSGHDEDKSDKYLPFLLKGRA